MKLPFTSKLPTFKFLTSIINRVIFQVLRFFLTFTVEHYFRDNMAHQLLYSFIKRRPTLH